MNYHLILIKSIDLAVLIKNTYLLGPSSLNS